MRATNPGPSRWVWFSPVMIIGSVCILAGILLILAVKNINREKQFMERALLSQANVLMRSVEAGSRTGMMGNGWGRQRRQTLIEEMAQQSEILYLALVDSMGRIIAHSDPEQVGKTLSPAFPRAGETSCRFTDKDPGAFEVMRTFQPWCRQSRRGPRNRFGWNSPESQRPLYHRGSRPRALQGRWQAGPAPDDTGLRNNVPGGCCRFHFTGLGAELSHCKIFPSGR